MTPRIANVSKTPAEEMRLLAIGAVSTAPAPKPATAMPVITPRLSGNHLIRVATGTM